MVSLILFTIFWLPIAIVTLDNISWDLRFWQNLDYKLENLIDNFRHGWEPGHRQPLLLAAKFIAFIFISVFIIDNTSLLPILGVGIAYAIWINQSMEIVAYRIRNGHKGVTFDRRGILTFIFTAAISSVLPVIATLAILNLRNGTSILEQLGGWLPNYSAQGFVLAPDVYLYLVLVTLIMLVLDLCSPLVTTLAVIISSPISYLKHQSEIATAKLKLQQQERLVKVLIVGTSAKSTTAGLLAHLLTSQYNVIQNKYTYTNALTLAKTINRELRSNTEVLISEIQITNPQDLEQIMQLITPQIIVCTGFSNLETEYWGTYQNLVSKYRQLFSRIPQHGRLIINKDSPIASDITAGLEVPVIYCSDDASNMSYHQNAIDYYRLETAAQHNDELDLIIHTYNFDIPFTVPAYYKNYAFSTLLSIAASNELGISFDNSTQMLGYFPVQQKDFVQIPGDHDTNIWFHSGKPKLQTLYSICNALPQESDQNIMLVTGVKEISAPNLLDKTIGDKLQQKFGTIITSDKELAKLLRKDNVHLQVFTVSTADKAIYLARKHLLPGANIAVLGNWEPKVINSLKADD